MKKYILIILIIVIIVAALGLVYYFLRSEKGTPSSEEEKPEYLVYTDEKWSFEIDYPSNWKEEQVQGQGLVAFEISAPEGGESAGLLIFAFNPSPEQVFEDEMQKSTEQLEGLGVLISSSKEAIADTNAYKLVYTYDDPFSGLMMKQQHYFIDGGEVWYQILYKAEQERFDKYLLEVEQMAESFKIVK